MQILIDMNLPLSWKTVFERAGHEARHWAEIGPPNAFDRTIMRCTRSRGFIVCTHDLDFSALLAATQAEGLSVIQLRAEDALPDALAKTVLRTLQQFKEALKSGALLSVNPECARVRLLPFGE